MKCSVGAVGASVGAGVLLAVVGAGAMSPAPRLLGQQPAHDWENEAVLSRNKEEPHATFFGFESIEAAVRRDRTTSSRFLSLNGTWRFNWVARPADRPVDFWRPETDVSDWDEIPVPSDWHLYGYCVPIYAGSTREASMGSRHPC